jgi:NADH-quinone oxidoreductase subunit L
MNLSVSLAILVPVLPLLAALIVLMSKSTTQHPRARLSVLPLTAAFGASCLTLLVVTSEGAIGIRCYDPSSVASPGLPLGFHIDRLSAVMMVPISGVGTISHDSIICLFQSPGLKVRRRS